MDPSQVSPELKSMIDEIKDWQIAHGLVLKTVPDESETRVSARTIGMSLLPTPFPRRLFEHALGDLQESMNLLYARAASDVDWLASVVTPLLEIDDLARSLWTIYRQVPKRDHIVCGIFQSDYMSQVDEPRQLKQMEMNTFAVAGPAHAQMASTLHRRLVRERQSGRLQFPSQDMFDAKSSHELADNDNIIKLCSSLRLAWDQYQPSTPDLGKCILMIVHDQAVEITDERPIEWTLNDMDVPCYRCAWSDIETQTTLTPDDTLFFHRHNDLIEVAVVYYRTGYEAEQYDHHGMQSRLRLETSRAIKCPDILTHITTFKTVQQALTKPNVLERFLPADRVAAVRDTFVYMQNLDYTPQGQQAIDLASLQTSAQNYMLKPNLERSGMNVVGKQIARFMCRVKPPHHPKFTLMEMIRSPTEPNILLREHMVFRGETTAELGVLGSCMWKRTVIESGGYEIESVMANSVVGWTFRTKPIDVRQSSVTRGWGCLGCPMLVDEEKSESSWSSPTTPEASSKM